MSFARLSLSLAGVVGVIAAALAAATIWLIMTQPVTIADAVAQGEVSPLVKALAGVLLRRASGPHEIPVAVSCYSVRFRNRHSAIPSIHLNGVTPVL